MSKLWLNGALILLLVSVIETGCAPHVVRRSAAPSARRSDAAPGKPPATRRSDDTASRLDEEARRLFERFNRLDPKLDVPTDSQATGDAAGTAGYLGNGRSSLGSVPATETSTVGRDAGVPIGEQRSGRAMDEAPSNQTEAGRFHLGHFILLGSDLAAIALALTLVQRRDRQQRQAAR